MNAIVETKKGKKVMKSLFRGLEEVKKAEIFAFDMECDFPTRKGWETNVIYDREAKRIRGNYW